jgi:hypothetical protein
LSRSNLWSAGRCGLAWCAFVGAASCAVEGADRSEEVREQRQALGAFNVLTRNIDAGRTGANLSETVLTTSNVNASTFGKVFELAVDDQIYAGLLYASNVTIGGASHNVVYAATVNNSLYAFDADTGAPLWQKNFNNGAAPVFHTQVGQNCGTYADMSGNIGIVGTPVIDGNSLTMYFVTRTFENGTTFAQRIRAVDITTGNERVAARTIGTIEPQINHQHAALALSQSKVYVAWSSHCDTGAYHGRVLAFNTSDLSQAAAFDAVPSGSGAGIWMSSAAPIVDASGNLFYATGNGTSSPASNNFGESIVRLGPTLNVADYFMPSNADALNGADNDLGSSGPIKVPGTNLLLMGGKGGGTCYLVDMTNMGHQVSGDTQIRQKWQCADPDNVRTGQSHHLHNAMVAWQSPAGLNVYSWSENDFGRAWRFNGSTFNTPPVSVSTVLPPLGMPGGMMALSASGSTAGTGVLWVSMPLAGDANQNVVPGVLRAFDAENLGRELWNSTKVIADSAKTMSKGAPPLVANGRVYLASLSNAVTVYGLRAASTNPDRTVGGTVTATGTACATTESADKLYDDDVTSKWCVTSAPSAATPISTVYDFAGSTAFAISKYTITTADDAPQRDPSAWSLQGCQGACAAASDSGWVTLDTRANEFAGAMRFQTNTYSFNNGTAYQQYRLRTTANGGDGLFQMAEVQLFEGGQCTSESDSAFCSRLGASCGALSAADNCGVVRSVSSCGSCTAPQTCGGSGSANVCGEASAIDRTEGGTATGTGTPCNATTEGVAQAYDNLLTSTNGTKWCVFSAPSTGTPISTVYDFAGTTAFAINKYALTTGNDSPDRDPKDWTLQGCQGTCTVASDAGWITLDTRTNQFAGAARYQTNSYTFNNATSYQQYRLRVTGNSGGAASIFQIGEIQLFEVRTCAPESDSAFCSRSSANCGPLTGTDNCGASRTVSSCGTCTSPQSCGGAGTPNVCGNGNVDRTEGGTATGTGTPCNTSTETVAKAYDNQMTSANFSKWCVTSAPSAGAPVSTMYDFAGTTAFVVTRYTITTGNDVPGRDPGSWSFQGCQGSCTAASDAGWVTLDTQANQFASASRYQTNSYPVANTTAYQQYRLRFTSNNGTTNRFQLAEIQMF